MFPFETTQIATEEDSLLPSSSPDGPPSDAAPFTDATPAPTDALDQQHQFFLSQLQRLDEVLAEQNQALVDFDRRLTDLVSQLNSLKNHF
jgi:hypothetical protein